MSYLDSTGLSYFWGKVKALANTKASKPITKVVTLTVAGWSGLSQTLSISEVTATNLIFTAPIPSHQDNFTDADIKNSGQGVGTLTFNCKTLPVSDIDVNIVIMEVSA